MKKEIFLDLLKHFLCSSVIGVVLSFTFNNWWLVLASFLSGQLIDIDHFFDYFWGKTSKLNLRDFFDPEKYVVPSQKVFVLFHGWEFVLFFIFIGGKLNSQCPGILFALPLSYFVHLLIDQLGSAGSPFSYFLTYRLLNKFSLTAYNGNK